MEGKVCIVTGSSNGIGEGIALMLAKRGASVTLCGRDLDKLQTVLKSCVEASGGHTDRFLTVAGDVVDASVREDIVQKTVYQFGRLDVLVANAGTMTSKTSIFNATEESYDYMMNLNTKSTFFLIQQAIPHLETSKGSIVVVSSSLSLFVGQMSNTIYPMTKAAVDHMVRCLAVDLGPKNIRVNCVNPGFVPTNLIKLFGVEAGLDQSGIDQMLSQVKKREAEVQPLGGDVLTVEAVAEAVCFLSSAAANFITGECLPVDAGRRFVGPSKK